MKHSSARTKISLFDDRFLDQDEYRAACLDLLLVREGAKPLAHGELSRILSEDLDGFCAQNDLARRTLPPSEHAIEHRWYLFEFLAAPVAYPFGPILDACAAPVTAGEEHGSLCCPFCHKDRATTIRIGELFGYPSCCATRYADYQHCATSLGDVFFNELAVQGRSLTDFACVPYIPCSPSCMETARKDYNGIIHRVAPEFCDVLRTYADD